MLGAKDAYYLNKIFVLNMVSSIPTMCQYILWYYINVFGDVVIYFHYQHEVVFLWYFEWWIIDEKTTYYAARMLIRTAVWVSWITIKSAFGAQHSYNRDISPSMAIFKSTAASDGCLVSVDRVILKQHVTLHVCRSHSLRWTTRRFLRGVPPVASHHRWLCT